MCVRPRAACAPHGRYGRRRGWNRTSGINGRGKTCTPRQKWSHWQQDYYFFFLNKNIKRIWMTRRSPPQNMGRVFNWISLNCVGKKNKYFIIALSSETLMENYRLPMPMLENWEDILDGLSLKWRFWHFQTHLGICSVKFECTNITYNVIYF